MEYEDRFSDEPQPQEPAPVVEQAPEPQPASDAIQGVVPETNADIPQHNRR